MYISPINYQQNVKINNSLTSQSKPFQSQSIQSQSFQASPTQFKNPNWLKRIGTMAASALAYLGIRKNMSTENSTSASETNYVDKNYKIKYIKN